MPIEQLHAAMARSIDQLDIVAVDDSKPTQSILRSMLNSFKVARVRTFDGPDTALEAMHIDPPNFIIIDWLMEPVDGISMLKSMRMREMGPLTAVPAIILTSSPTTHLVELALKAGAHSILAKPISPDTLKKRIEAVCADGRPMHLDERTGSWILFGAAEMWEEQLARQRKFQVRKDYIEGRKRLTIEMPNPVARPAPRPAPVVEAAPEPIEARKPRKTVGFGARRVMPDEVAGPTKQD